MSKEEMMFLAALVAVLLLLVMHLLRIAFWKSMPDWLRHVLGVLGLTIPLTVLFYKWQSWNELKALWLVILFGGGVLLLAFVLESWYQDHVARIQAEERERSMMQSVRGEHEQSK